MRHIHTVHFMYSALPVYILCYTLYMYNVFFGMDAIPQFVEFSVPTSVPALPAEVASKLVSHYKITPM